MAVDEVHPPETVRPEGYPTRWEVDVVLSDGATVHVRPIRPDDADRLVRFHSRQSAHSIYLRFFSPRPRLSDREIVRFTTVDFVERMAFIAVLGDEMIGVARYDRLGPENTAEVAFFIDDAHHGRGLGTLLLEYLAAAAKENGITRLVATTLPENRGMINVFRRTGFEVSTAFADGVVEVALGIDPTPEGRVRIDERARRAEARSVARLLRPASVAVVGASREPGTVGHEVVRQLLAGPFEGPVYPVNPAAAHVRSVRAYPTIGDIPDEVDLAVVAVPIAAVAEVIEDCARKRVGGLVVLSLDPGAEAESDGAIDRNRELVALARLHGMRLVGPGSIGLVNTDPALRLRATIAPARVHRGRVGLSAQSGSLGAAILEEAAEVGIGLSSFVGLGSKADVSGNDLLQYWEDDPATDVILLYLESFGNPRKFFRIARRIAPHKPIVVVRTGSLGPDASLRAWPTPATYSALLAQAGVIEVATLTELFDVARLVDSQPVPAGGRVLVVANAPAVARLTAEAATRVGLELATPVGDGWTSNPVVLPVDVDEGDYRAALAAALPAEGVDAAIVVFAPPIQRRADRIAAAVEEVAASAGKTVVATFLGERAGDEPSQPGRVPHYRFPEDAARALAHAARLGTWRRDAADAPSVPLEPAEPDAGLVAAAAAVDAALAAGHDVLPLADAVAVLGHAGIATVGQAEVTDVEAAVAAAARIGYPVVLKAGRRGPLARTEATGLALGLHDADDLRGAYGRMCEALGEAMDHAIVQGMGRAGLDAQVVAHTDERLGPLVALGRGGSAGSAPDELAVRLVPLLGADAPRLVDASPLGSVLRRADPPVDVDGLATLLVRLGALVDAVPALAEIRLDPVLVSPGGVDVTDVTIRVAPVAPPSGPDVRRLGG